MIDTKRVREDFAFASSRGKWYDITTGDILSSETSRVLLSTKKRISEPHLRLLARSVIELQNFKASHSSGLGGLSVAVIDSLANETTTLRFESLRDKYHTVKLLEASGVDTFEHGGDLLISKANRDVVVGSLLKEGKKVDFKSKQSVEHKTRQKAGLVFYDQKSAKGQDRFFRINQGDKTLSIVCDGHGTDTAIDYITKNKLDFAAILDEPFPVTREAIAARVTKVFVDFENALRSSVQASSSGSTIVLAAQHQGRIFFAHAGDSRAVYQERSGAAILATRDHKPDDPSEESRIKRLGGKVVKDRHGTWRVGGDLATSRSFGDETLKSVSEDRSLDWVSVYPDILGPFNFGDDSIFVLGSDGVFDVLSNEYIITTIRNSKDITSVATTLVQAAYNAGSRDDITIAFSVGRLLQ